MLSMLLYVIIIENSYNNNNNNVQNKVSLSKAQWLNVPKKKKKEKKGRCGSRERHKKQNKAPHVSHI